MPIMEIAIEPVGGDKPHMHEVVARSVRVLPKTGLAYRVGAMSTVVQGSVAQLLSAAAQMHAAAIGGDAPRLLTTIRIDETRAGERSLDDRVRVVEQSI